jgi:hydrogenase/urease accessory protein HupE
LFFAAGGLERALLAIPAMKSTLRRVVSLAAVVLAAAPLLRAHPGHDGDHGLTWDFTHVANHPLVTLGWTVVAIAVLGAAWWLARRLTQPTVQSLRGSAASRGK